MEGEFWAIVGNDGAWFAVFGYELVQLPRYTLTCQRILNNKDKTFAVEVINNAQNAKTSPIHQWSTNKVNTPTLINLIR